MRKPFPGFHAFTLSFDQLVNRLISDAGITEAFDPKTDPTTHPKPLPVKALWDTGATSSVVTPWVVKDLGLSPVGKSFLNHGGGRSEQMIYVVNLYLPNGVGFVGVPVAEMDKIEDSGFGIIIGMDIIASGDFSLTNFQRKTCFSFRVPSQQRVDYVVEWNSRVKRALGPNDPCHCGNGKKFKKCHGSRG